VEQCHQAEGESEGRSLLCHWGIQMFEERTLGGRRHEEKGGSLGNSHWHLSPQYQNHCYLIACAFLY
jgi:hypothetical protein